MDKNISFIASTLPVRFVVKNNKKLGINTIYVPTRKLKRSLDFIKNITHKEIKIKVLPKKKVFQFLFMLGLMIKSRIKQRKVIFFHEISWLMFDIAFHIVKPTYDFFPQVSLLHIWENPQVVIEEKKAKIETSILFLDKILKFLGYFNIVPKFQLLFHPVDNYNFKNLQYYSGFSCQSYKSKRLDLNVSLNPSKKKTKGKFIILCGIEFGCKDEQRDLIEQIIKLIKDKGINFEFKGHPNWENVYPDNNENKIIDKYIPFEILDSTEFIGIIGFGSTVLTRYPKKCISLLYFQDSISSDLIERKVLSLKKNHHENDCFYPKNKIELNKKIDLLIRNFNKE